MEGADVGGARAFRRLRLVDARRGEAEHETGFESALGTGVLATEMHSIGVDPDRGLHVVVHDKSRR